MKMRGRFRDGLWKIYSFVSAFEFTSGVVFVVTLSCVLSIVTNHFNISGHTLSLESSVVLNGHGKILLQNMLYRMHCTQVTNITPCLFQQFNNIHCIIMMYLLLNVWFV